MLQYSYAYDDLGQLTRENNLPANRTYLYSYDKDGNMLSKTECYYSLAVATPIGTTSFTYDGTKSDCLTKITFPGGKVFSTYYGSTGNPAHIITENGNTMAAMWSYGRRLTMVVAGPDMFTYDYNADGIRTTKTVNGVKHTYALSGTTILNEEWTENGVQHLLMYVYDANGSPVGMVYRNSTMAANATEEYLFVKNIQGDILCVYSSTGNKLVSYVYDAWGNIISTTYSNGGGTSAARFNPFTYRGYYRDSETGMYYLNSRYYNPKMGRFISADGVINGNGDLLGYNLYAYCSNNPVMYSDISGEGLLTWIKNAWTDTKNAAIDAYNYVTNDSETVVLNAKYVAFYKGRVVVKLPIGTDAASFGIIFLGQDVAKRNDAVETVQHEYGHTKQLLRMGPLVYATCVAAPSVNCNLLDRIGWLKYDYYSFPWDYEADKYGGVNRGNYESWADIAMNIYKTFTDILKFAI